MKTLLKVVAGLLLLINGLGALYGGWNLMTFPDGSGFGLPLSILQHSPFTDFFLPGLILFVFNGLCSIAVLAALWLNRAQYPWLVIGQGAILVGWIGIQILLIRGTGTLHWIFGGIGLLLMVSGALLVNANRKYANFRREPHTR